MPTTKRLFYLTVISAFLLTIVSLGIHNSMATPFNGKYGGTIIIGMKGDFDSFNELNAGDADALQVINNMLFMTLTRLDSQLQITPYLAESWQFAPGDTTLTFHLRRDVFWTDGHPTTAEDVLFTCKIAVDPDYAYPGSSRFDLVKNVEVKNKFTVIFHLKKAYPDVLLDTQMPILPKHILQNLTPEEMASAPFNRQPVGNGPFILQSWQANQRLVFEANPKFALGRPFLDRVIFAVIPDETVLFNSLVTGEIDLAPAILAQQFTQLSKTPNRKSIRYASRGYTFVAWNVTRPWLTKTVRQALTHAINRKEIINTLLEGFGQSISGPLMPFSWAYDKNLQGLSFDPARARQLLAEAGWTDSNADGTLDRDGKEFRITLKTNAESQLRTDATVMIQAQLKKIGVQVEVAAVEWNALLKQVFEAHDFDGLILGWDADFTVDPTPLWHSSAIENGFNFIGYANTRIDDLIERGRASADRKKALSYWREFQNIIVQDSPYTFLFMKDNLAGANTRIHDLKMDVRGFLANIHAWWVPQSARKY
ncbi:MAG: peptide-binding protein [bacterium]